MDVFKFAWRNVWRQRRRTWITISAMAFALCVLILYAGVILGYVQSMERKILDLELGELQVFSAEYEDAPSLHATLPDGEALAADLRQRGFAATGRLLAFGMVAAGESATGAAFRGIDLATNAGVSEVGREIAAGAWLERDDAKGVVIGAQLARALEVAPGSELLMLSEAADGSMAYDLFPVRGVLRRISSASDQSVYMVDAAFREMFVLEQGLHQLVVRQPAGIDLATAAARAEEVAVARGVAIEIKTWRQLIPTLASMLDAMGAAMGTILVVFYIAVALLVLNAMLMSVFERVREFGVLKALGVGPGGVFRLILVESGIQTAVAIGIAMVVAIPGIAYLASYGIDMASLAGISIVGIAMDPVWRATSEPVVFVQPVLTLIVMVTLAVLYPAAKAALIRPVQAMRHH